jgi:hypothetical protein
MPVFAILVHDEPLRLLELLKILHGYDILIHIDKYSSRERFLSEIKTINCERIRIIPESQSIGGAWGGYSLVEIQLKLMEEFLRNTKFGGPLVFLSGQDFPIRPLLDFEKYLETKQDFFSIQMINKEKISDGDYIENARLNRIGNLHLQDFRLFRRSKNRRSFRYLIGSIPAGITRRMKLPNFKFNADKDFYIGSQWLGLSRKLCELLLAERKALKTEFRFSFCPDEIAIQTFLGRYISNLESATAKILDGFDAVIDADFHLIHPSLAHKWQINELDSILKSKKFFIRKPSDELANYLGKCLR